MTASGSKLSMPFRLSGGLLDHWIVHRSDQLVLDSSTSFPRFLRSVASSSARESSCTFLRLSSMLAATSR